VARTLQISIAAFISKHRVSELLKSEATSGSVADANAAEVASTRFLTGIKVRNPFRQIQRFSIYLRISQEFSENRDDLLRSMA